MAQKLPEMKELPNGHKMGRDMWQFVIRHPNTCKQREKATITGEYTYITQKNNLPWELRQCGMTDTQINELTKELA